MQPPISQALDQAEADGLLEDWNDLLELLDGQFTEGDPPSEDAKLEILTMHGAKGLEWDLVVLPALNRPTGGVDHDLLHWLPFTASDAGGEQVLLAPLRSADEKSNRPLVELIRNEQKTRTAYENERLLYVATTRAREHLVLSACLAPNSDGDISPGSGTLLANLWPQTGTDFLAALAADAGNNADGESAASPDAQAAGIPSDQSLRPDQTLRRVESGWRPPIGSRIAWQPVLPSRERAIEIEFNWAGIDARRAGRVLHRLLECVGTLGIEHLDADRRQRLIARIPTLLRAMGSRGKLLDDAIATIRHAFESTLNSDAGVWLLSGRYRDAACELRISGVIDDQLVNAVVDRTFIDDDGVRWIIDYKSGYHAGADLESFFAAEGDRYRIQLGIYRRLFEQLGERNIRTALYLPRHGRLEIVDTRGILSSR